MTFGNKGETSADKLRRSSLIQHFSYLGEEFIKLDETIKEGKRNRSAFHDNVDHYIKGIVPAIHRITSYIRQREGTFPELATYYKHIDARSSDIVRWYMHNAGYLQKVYRDDTEDTRAGRAGSVAANLLQVVQAINDRKLKDDAAKNVIEFLDKTLPPIPMEKRLHVNLWHCRLGTLGQVYLMLNELSQQLNNPQ